MTALTPKEISKLPKYARPRAGGVYRVADNAYIDNVSGYGATKSHTEIRARGFVSVLPIDTALSLFSTSEAVPDVSHIEQRIAAGEGVAAPQLYLDIEEYMAFTRRGSCKIVDQSGLETCHALKKVGVENITVQVILLGYSMKNIDNQDDFFNCLSGGVTTLDGKSFRGLVNLSIN